MYIFFTFLILGASFPSLDAAADPLAMFCDVTVSFDYPNGQDAEPEVKCTEQKCSKFTDGFYSTRMFYENDDVSRKFGKMVEINVLSSNLVPECTLVPVAPRSAIIAAEKKLADKKECTFNFPIPTTQCADGYTYDEKIKTCILLIDEEDQWPEAECYCSGNGGTLVIIDTQAKQEHYAEMIQNVTIWLGLSDMEEEGTFVWKDGTPLSETSKKNFAEGELESNSALKNCVMMGEITNMEWKLESCSAKNKFICEEKAPEPTMATTAEITTPATTTVSTTTVIGPHYECPKGWVKNEETSNCVYYDPTSKKKKSYGDAVKFCSSLMSNAKLATISNYNEWQFIKDNVVKDGTALLGLKYDDKSSKYMWEGTSGQPTFRKWTGSKAPNRCTKSFWGMVTSCKDCTVMSSQDQYKWDAESCSTGAIPLCEMPTEKIPRTSCPAERGWKEHKSHCYYFSEEDSKSKDEALKACEQRAYNAELLEPNLDEDKFVAKFGKPGTAYIIDAVWKDSKREYQSTDGEKSTHIGNIQKKSVWGMAWSRTKKFVGFNEKEKCLKMKDGKWYKIKCTNRSNYVCRTFGPAKTRNTK